MAIKAKVVKSSVPPASPVSHQEEGETILSNEFVKPTYNAKDMLQVCENSTILGQCITSYKQNIAGFGHVLKYRGDDKEETGEMKAEWNFLNNELLPFFSFDLAFKEILEQGIEDREKIGSGYLEVIRNGANLPCELVNVDKPEYMRISRLSDYQEVTYTVRGTEHKRKKKFRYFMQEVTPGHPVYFKQFGDPRFLHAKTGKFTEKHNGEDEATEILQLKVGSGVYGTPRWIPHVLHITGARKAEELNYRYFKQGRHTPMAILVKGGKLSEGSEQAITEYADSVEGENGQHKFLLFEAEPDEDNVSFDGSGPSVEIELKSLADMLQQDALFLEYDEKSRRKVQSAFRLPDIYVGYSTDFNRATADTAREITEEQVFQPERESLEFIINNILLLPHGLQHVEVKLAKPEISNSQDKARMLSVLNQIGGIAPDDVREEVAKVLGKSLENFDVDQSKLPLVLQKNKTMASTSTEKLNRQDEVKEL